jgi:AbiV family abortive infection protein
MMSDETWDAVLTEALGCGERLILDSSEFDSVCDHIVQLIQDAVFLLRNGSAATAAFLAITAVEETVKAHVGMFRRPSSPTTKRCKDALYQHRHKHRLAAAQTVSIGHRLEAAIGDEELTTLLELARSGKLREIRESCLYFERRAKELIVPMQALSSARARSLILLAIELFDDQLVGYTNHSLDLSASVDVLFDELKA